MKADFILIQGCTGVVPDYSPLALTSGFTPLTSIAGGSNPSRPREITLADTRAAQSRPNFCALSGRLMLGSKSRFGGHFLLKLLMGLGFGRSEPTWHSPCHL